MILLVLLLAQQQNLPHNFMDPQTTRKTCLQAEPLRTLPTNIIYALVVLFISKFLVKSSLFIHLSILESVEILTKVRPFYMWNIIGFLGRKDRKQTSQWGQEKDGLNYPGNQTLFKSQIKSIQLYPTACQEDTNHSYLYSVLHISVNLHVLKWHLKMNTV